MLAYQAAILIFASVSNIRYIQLIARFQPKFDPTYIRSCLFDSCVKFERCTKYINDAK